MENEITDSGSQNVRYRTGDIIIFRDYSGKHKTGEFQNITGHIIRLSCDGKHKVIEEGRVLKVQRETHDQLKLWE